MVDLIPPQKKTVNVFQYLVGFASILLINVDSAARKFERKSGALKRGPYTCSTFKVFNLKYTTYMNIAMYLLAQNVHGSCFTIPPKISQIFETGKIYNKTIFKTKDPHQKPPKSQQSSINLAKNQLNQFFCQFLKSSIKSRQILRA